MSIGWAIFTLALAGVIGVACGLLLPFVIALPLAFLSGLILARLTYPLVFKE